MTSEPETNRPPAPAKLAGVKVFFINESGQLSSATKLPSPPGVLRILHSCGSVTTGEAFDRYSPTPFVAWGKHIGHLADEEKWARLRLRGFLHRAATLRRILVPFSKKAENIEDAEALAQRTLRNIVSLRSRRTFALQQQGAISRAASEAFDQKRLSEKAVSREGSS
jgi:hypothetical protein